MSMPPPPPPGYNQGGQPPYPSQPGPPPYGGPPGYQAYPSAPTGYSMGPNYAGFGGRLGALIIDGLIGAIFAIPAIVALFAGPKHLGTCTVNGNEQLCDVPNGATVAITVLLGAVGAIAYLVLFCRKVGAGQSWGMKATNIRLVDANTGQPVGTGRAVGWYFAHIVSGFICYLGYLWMLWDARKQTWHDKIVGTVMIRA